jgi:hypothetical protein
MRGSGIGRGRLQRRDAEARSIRRIKGFRVRDFGVCKGDWRAEGAASLEATGVSGEEKPTQAEMPVPQKSKAPSWVTRGLHSENGGGRGLTARDAVCVELIITV